MGGSVFFALARAPLAFAFVAYVVVVASSALGAAPLGSRAAAWGVLTLAVLAALVCARGARGGRSEEAAASAFAWVGRIAAGAGGLALFTVAMLAALLPIGAYDALGYRLPAVAGWLDAGAVVWLTGDDPLRNGYPLALEVIEAVIFRALGSSALIDAVAVPFVLAGALALAGWVRQAGGARWAALLAFGLFALVPIHLLNAPSGYADAALSGALVALFVAVARWVDDETAPTFKRSTSAAVDAGVSAALVIALKPHGFAFAGMAVGVGLWSRARRAGRGRALRELAIVAACAGPGLFFAARNLAKTGNPLYPLELTLFGRVLLKGEASLDGILTPAFNVPPELARLPALLRPAWVWLQPHGPAVSFDDRLAGLGYAFPVLGLPALLMVLYRAVARRTEPRGVHLVALLTLGCLIVQPFAFWPRFTSWLWGAAALALALLVSELAQRGEEARALVVSLSSLLLAVPEALVALVHVKGLDRLGLSPFFESDAVTRLSQVAGIDRGFVQRALVGRRDVCRTGWVLGTDDANIDGIAAQLSPRPRVHVVDESRWDDLSHRARAHGCEELIVIGDAPLLARIPREWAARVEPATAFGRCHLISLSSSEVNP